MRSRFRGVLIALWIATAAIGVVVAAELALQYRAARLEGRIADDGTRLARLDRAYQPFTVQHLHPHFLFFFPLQRAERVAMGNDVCSIDADGFREPGPARAGGRKLAVMLGGSAAFGHYASSNDTTIASYLNRLQDEYFFVSAGVPSWNSTQSLIRLATQVIDLRPSLVLSYDGINDAALADLGNDRHPDWQYPAGTPESFDRLQNMVDDLRRPPHQRGLPDLFPQLTHRYEKHFGHAAADSAPGAPPDPGQVKAAAHRYVENLVRMSELSRASGARFVAVLQPMAYLHRNVDPEKVGSDDLIVAFHHEVVARQPRPFEFHDFSAIFDQHFNVVPARSGDIMDDTIFVDAAHITDRGSEIVAARLRDVVRGTAGAVDR